MKRILFILLFICISIGLRAQVFTPPMYGAYHVQTPVRLTTTAISGNSTGNSAQSGGSMTVDAGIIINEKGICWGINSSPTIAGSKLNSGSGTGSYTANMTGLSPLTRYYVRAYVITATSAVFYGNEIMFITAPIFEYTGTVQSFTVPAGITALKFDVWGAQGGGGENYAGGNGGYVSGRLNGVTEGQTFYVYVGQKGVDLDYNRTAAFNGGGRCGWYAGGGGGASDVRTAVGDLNTRIIVAGGGGGAGTRTGAAGGNGGYPTGANGTATIYGPAGGGGSGGTQSAGGAGGTGKTSGHAGYPGQKGIGGDGGSVSTWVGLSGGGGGGYYGGGGGGGGDEAYVQGSTTGGYGGSGGGGSSYYGTLASPTHTAGARAGNGRVVITLY